MLLYIYKNHIRKEIIDMTPKKRVFNNNGYIPDNEELSLIENILEKINDKQASFIFGNLIKNGKLENFEDIQNNKLRGEELKDSSYRKKENGIRSITDQDNKDILNSGVKVSKDIFEEENYSVLNKNEAQKIKELFKNCKNLKDIINDFYKELIIKDDKHKDDKHKDDKDKDNKHNIDSIIQQGTLIFNDIIKSNNLKDSIELLTKYLYIINQEEEINSTNKINNIQKMVLRTFNKKEKIALYKGIELLYNMNIQEYQNKKHKVEGFAYIPDTTLSYVKSKENTFFDYKEKAKLKRLINQFFNLIIELREGKNELKAKANNEDLSDEDLINQIYQYYEKYYLFYAINEPSLFSSENCIEKMDKEFEEMVLKIKTITKDEAVQLKKELCDKLKEAFM